MDKIIEMLKQQYNEKILQTEKEMKSLLKKFEILKMLQGKKFKTKKDVEKTMSVLCFSAPQYCCASKLSERGVGKDCPFRDSFWKVLGLTLKDYENYKKQCEELFWKFLKRKGAIKNE